MSAAYDDDDVSPLCRFALDKSFDRMEGDFLRISSSSSESSIDDIDSVDVHVVNLVMHCDPVFANKSITENITASLPVSTSLADLVQLQDSPLTQWFESQLVSMETVWVWRIRSADVLQSFTRMHALEAFNTEGVHRGSAIYLEKRPLHASAWESDVWNNPRMGWSQAHLDNDPASGGWFPFSLLSSTETCESVETRISKLLGRPMEMLRQICPLACVDGTKKGPWVVEVTNESMAFLGSGAATGCFRFLVKPQKRKSSVTSASPKTKKAKGPTNDWQLNELWCHEVFEDECPPTPCNSVVSF